MNTVGFCCPWFLYAHFFKQLPKFVEASCERFWNSPDDITTAAYNSHYHRCPHGGERSLTLSHTSMRTCRAILELHQGFKTKTSSDHWRSVKILLLCVIDIEWQLHCVDVSCWHLDLSRSVSFQLLHLWTHCEYKYFPAEIFDSHLTDHVLHRWHQNIL